MSSTLQWWTGWFDEQSALCRVSRAHDSRAVVRAALGSTPETTALVAEIILIHECEPVGARDRKRDCALTLRR